MDWYQGCAEEHIPSNLSNQENPQSSIGPPARMSNLRADLKKQEAVNNAPLESGGSMESQEVVSSIIDAGLDTAEEETEESFNSAPAQGSVNEPEDMYDLTLRTSSYLSEATRKLALAHFESYRPIRFPLNEFPRDDLIFSLYIRLCPREPVPESNRNPSQFIDLLEDCFVFYIKKFYPYFHEQLDRGRLAASVSPSDPRMFYYWLFDTFWPREPNTIHPFVNALYRRKAIGILRQGQVDILTTMVRNMLTQLAVVLEFEPGVVEDGEAKAVRLAEFERIVSGTYRMVTNFLGSSSFHSERVEALLLRYLAEDDVNWDLVRALDAIQRGRVDVCFDPENLIGLPDC